MSHVKVIKLLLSMFLVLALAGFTSPARADDETARLHFQAGASEFAAGRFESALASFTAAFELSERPQLLYNIALCHEELRHFGEAAAHLRRFLDEVESVAQRAAIERRVELLEAAAAKQESAEDEEPAPLEDDEHEFEALPEPGRSSAPSAAWASFGVSGAGLLIGIVLGSVGLARKNALEARCGATSSCDPDEVKRMERLGIAADVSLGIAIAATAAGTALFFALRDREGDHTVSAAPWAAPRSAGLSISRRF
jgi:tetratricopeptide (TPR) repeat protein